MVDGLLQRLMCPIALMLRVVNGGWLSERLSYKLTLSTVGKTSLLVKLAVTTLPTE